MKYDIILENWKKYLNEQDEQLSQIVKDTEEKMQQGTQSSTEELTGEQQQQAALDTLKGSIANSLKNATSIAKKTNVSTSQLRDFIKSLADSLIKESKKNKSDDRCTRIAKRKYDVWPSAYASGAVVRCRQGKIWKGVSENATNEEIDAFLLLEKSDPKVGTGKKPKDSDRRLYTDENPNDTVSVKFSTVQDIKDTLSKESFKSKSHARQSQIINLIHQRVRVAYDRAKEPEVKSRLKKALDYAEERKEASKEKTKNLQEEQQGNQLNERCWKGYTQKGMKTMFGKKYPNCVKVTKEQIELEEVEVIEEEVEVIEEEWSDKYKRSIDCKNPKGFSQRAHCQGKKKNEEVETEEETLDEAKKPYKPNFSKEKEQGLHGWFARNDGKGWVNCRTGGPCGRESADSGGKYPACRPTKAQCKSAGKGPLRKKKSSEPISWTKNKKD
jgi:hypothetical protein